MNRVKDLNKDAARRSLKHAVANTPPLTGSGADSPTSRRSASPSPRPAAAVLSRPSASSHSLDDLPTTLYRELTSKLRDRLVQSSPYNSTLQQRHQTTSMDACPVTGTSDALSASGGGPWFLPVSDRPAAQTVRRRRESTLDDIDELTDEPVVYSRQSVVDNRQLSPPTDAPQPVVAWHSDDESLDDKTEVAAEKLECDLLAADSRVSAMSDIQALQTSNDAMHNKHQSARLPNSDPAVSVDQHRATRSHHVPGNVHSDFILSSTTKSVMPLCPRETVCKMHVEGGDTTNVCCASSADVSDKASSKLDDTFGMLPDGGVERQCLAANNLNCYRLEQVVRDNSSGGDTTMPSANNIMDHETSRTSTAGRSETVQRTSGPTNGRATMTSSDDRQPRQQTQARRQSDRKQLQAATETRSQVVEKQLSANDNYNNDNKHDFSSSPETVKLLTELISKIAELSKRQDLLECVRTVPCQDRAHKSSQTDIQSRDELNAPQVSSMSKVRPPVTTGKPQNVLRTHNKQQLLSNSDVARQSAVSREETLFNQSRRQLSASERSVGTQTQHQITRSQTNSNVLEANRGSYYTPLTNNDAIEPTKLTNSWASEQRQQRDYLGVAGVQRPPPSTELLPAPASAIEDSIIHIVRGSSALDELTVEDLLLECRDQSDVIDEQQCEPDVDDYQPVMQTGTLSAHSHQVLQAPSTEKRQSQSPVTSISRSPRPTDLVDRQDSPRWRRDTSQRDARSPHDTDKLHPADVALPLQHSHDRRSVQSDLPQSPRSSRQSQAPNEFASFPSRSSRVSQQRTPNDPPHSPRPSRQPETPQIGSFPSRSSRVSQQRTQNDLLYSPRPSRQPETPQEVGDFPSRTSRASQRPTDLQHSPRPCRQSEAPQVSSFQSRTSRASQNDPPHSPRLSRQPETPQEVGDFPSRTSRANQRPTDLQYSPRRSRQSETPQIGSFQSRTSRASQNDPPQSPRLSRKSETRQEVDDFPSRSSRVSQRRTENDRLRSPRPSRQSATLQEVSSFPSRSSRVIQPSSEHQTADGVSRTAAEQHEHRTSQRTPVKSADEHSELKMQYVLWRTTLL